jgi:hypothetical protein
MCKVDFIATINNYYGYIYLIVDHFHNKVYVGKRKGLIEQSKNYYGGGKIIKAIPKHYLQKIILGVCNSKEELNSAEIECIYFYRSYGSDGNNIDFIYGYNLSKGGDGGVNGYKRGPLTEEHRQKLREAKLKNPTRFWKDKHFSKEHLNKLSNSHKGIKQPTNGKTYEEIFGDKAEIMRKKCRNKNAGKHITKEHKMKISEAFKQKRQERQNYEKSRTD